MIGPLGHLVLVQALFAAAIGGVVVFVGARSGRESLVTIGGDLGFVVLGFVVAACLAMEYALISHDFSVAYVAQVGSRETPLFFTIISLWSALEGSVLLWTLLLSVYTAAVIWWSRRQTPRDPLVSYALGTLLLVNVFFLLLVVGPADPFATVFPVPENGPGPNALLQNHWFMAVHPPLLYTGYVGMAVPFSFAIGALLVSRVDRDWSRMIRVWTLVPWMFLSLGVVAGAWWSYEVLGWGGYWAWDPVENASFMPWLTATAFLHSLMMQERKEMLKIWTVALIIMTFVLTLLGTFLTRSGIIASVHAFSEGVIGPYFLGFMAIVLLLSLVLLTWRAPTLSTQGRFDSALARETAFLVNNLLFTAFTFVMLLGTLFPLIVEAIQGTRVSVGAPYFNQMNVPIALALVFLVGVGPALPWGRGDPGVVRRKFIWPTVSALGAGGALAILGVREFLPWLTFVLAVFSVGLLLGEWIGPAAARRKARAESWPRALAQVPLSSRRRYGGYMVHFGILLIAVGIASSSSFKQETEWVAQPGTSERVGRYLIQLDSVWAVEELQRDAVIAAVTVSTDAGTLGRFYPRINYYPNSVQPIGTPAVREGLREDLYLVLAAYATDGTQTSLRAIVSPLVTWIWIGGALVGLGALFAMTRPSKREPQEAPERGGAKATRKGRLADAAVEGGS